MTTTAEPRATTDEQRPVRPVIEHALTAYGYSPKTVQALLDRLIAEAGAK